MIPAVATSKRDLPAPPGAQFGAHHRRHLARSAGSFPRYAGLRPTPDRVRETLFNWLQHSLQGTRCLDLFAGSGALGLEALSRGAAEVVFVEQFPQRRAPCRSNLVRLSSEGKGRVMEMGAARFLRTPAKPFDVAFLDPPFGKGRAGRIHSHAGFRRFG